MPRAVPRGPPSPPAALRAECGVFARGGDLAGIFGDYFRAFFFFFFLDSNVFFLPPSPSLSLAACSLAPSLAQSRQMRLSQYSGASRGSQRTTATPTASGSGAQSLQTSRVAPRRLALLQSASHGIAFFFFLFFWIYFSHRLLATFGLLVHPRAPPPGRSTPAPGRGVQAGVPTSSVRPLRGRIILDLFFSPIFFPHRLLHLPKGSSFIFFFARPKRPPRARAPPGGAQGPSGGPDSSVEPLWGSDGFILIFSPIFSHRLLPTLGLLFLHPKPPRPEQPSPGPRAPPGCPPPPGPPPGSRGLVVGSAGPLGLFFIFLQFPGSFRRPRAGLGSSPANWCPSPPVPKRAPRSGGRRTRSPGLAPASRHLKTPRGLRRTIGALQPRPRGPAPRSPGRGLQHLAPGPVRRPGTPPARFPSPDAAGLEIAARRLSPAAIVVDALPLQPSLPPPAPPRPRPRAAPANRRRRRRKRAGPRAPRRRPPSPTPPRRGGAGAGPRRRATPTRPRVSPAPAVGVAGPAHPLPS